LVALGMCSICSKIVFIIVGITSYFFGKVCYRCVTDIAILFFHGDDLFTRIFVLLEQLVTLV